MIERNCEIAVVGGGGSGLTAAVRAAQLSRQTIVVLEKSSVTGGGMVMASTMRTFRSKWQKDRALPDVTDAFLRKAMDNTYWRLDPKLVGNAILATGQFFDWFCELAGEEISKQFRIGRYVFDDETGPLGPQMGGPGGVTGSGRLFMDTLRKKCGEFGIEILTRHRVKDCEITNGKITALIADSPEGEVRVSCDTCILSIGSWINNTKMMAEICPQFLEARKYMKPSAHMNPNYTGDGLKIAKKLDAMMDKRNYTLRTMGPMVISKSGVMSFMTNSPYSLAINTSGKRYICEPSQVRNGVFNSGMMMLEQPKGYVYILFDTNNLAAAIRDNNENPVPGIPGLDGMPTLPDTLEAAFDDVEAVLGNEPNIWRADSLETLSAQMGVDPKALKQTVEEYNRDCSAGFDSVCFKDHKYMVPCCRAPFYAVQAQLGTDGAFGGIQVNGNMQAYRADGSLIDKLYVTGDFASGRFINLAGVKVQILNDMSWALASGFLAGTNAAEANR